MSQDKTLATSVNTELSENWQEHRKLLNQVEGDHTPDYQPTPMKAVMNEPNKEIIKRNVQNIGDVSDWESAKAYISSFVEEPASISGVQAVQDDPLRNKDTVRIKSTDREQDYLDKANIDKDVIFEGKGRDIAKGANIDGSLVGQEVEARKLAEGATIGKSLDARYSNIEWGIAEDAKIGREFIATGANSYTIGENATIEGILDAEGAVSSRIGKDAVAKKFKASLADSVRIGHRAIIENDFVANDTSASKIAERASIGGNLIARRNKAYKIGEFAKIVGNIDARDSDPENLKINTKVGGEIYQD